MVWCLLLWSLFIVLILVVDELADEVVVQLIKICDDEFKGIHARMSVSGTYDSTFYFWI